MSLAMEQWHPQWLHWQQQFVPLLVIHVLGLLSVLGAAEEVEEGWTQGETHSLQRCWNAHYLSPPGGTRADILAVSTLQALSGFLLKADEVSVCPQKEKKSSLPSAQVILERKKGEGKLHLPDTFVKCTDH